MRQMRSLHSYKKQKGFTIVELLIVIVVIGILATLVIVTFTGIQRRARDTQRQTDINAIQSHVEAFYADHGYYPTTVDLQSTTFLTNNMRGLKSDALLAPNSSAQIDANTATTTKYQYVASTTTTGNTCTNGDPSDASTNGGCDSYHLEAALEADPANPYIKTSD